MLSLVDLTFVIILPLYEVILFYFSTHWSELNVLRWDLVITINMASIHPSVCPYFLNDIYTTWPRASKLYMKLLYSQQRVISAVWWPYSRSGFISSVTIFFRSFGINDFNTFSIENWVPLKPVLADLRDVALYYL